MNCKLETFTLSYGSFGFDDAQTLIEQLVTIRFGFSAALLNITQDILRSSRLPFGLPILVRHTDLDLSHSKFGDNPNNVSLEGTSRSNEFLTGACAVWEGAAVVCCRFKVINRIDEASVLLRECFLSRFDPFDMGIVFLKPIYLSCEVSAVEVNLASQIGVVIQEAIFFAQDVVGLNSVLRGRNRCLNADLPLNREPSNARCNEGHNPSDRAASKSKPIGRMRRGLRADNRQRYGQEASQYCGKGYKSGGPNAGIEFFHSASLTRDALPVERAA